jgi:ribonucleotide monophosphatase NagD (HAD superfamily)
MTKERPKTIFCDIDGTLIKHHGNLSAQLTHPLELLPGTLDAINEWERNGYTIILVTGRKECMRIITEKQLIDAGIFYDQLIMGISSGDRILINDDKPNNVKTSIAITTKRNVEIKEVKL